MGPGGEVGLELEFGFDLGLSQFGDASSKGVDVGGKCVHGIGELADFGVCLGLGGFEPDDSVFGLDLGFGECGHDLFQAGLAFFGGQRLLLRGGIPDSSLAHIPTPSAGM